jgi:hypothetical protein
MIPRLKLLWVLFPALLFALLASARPSAPTPAAARHAIMISIDGLIPSSYTEPLAHGLKIPALRELAVT